MKKKKKWIVIIIIAVAAVAIFAAVKFFQSRLNSVAGVVNSVQLEEVTTRDLSDFISVSGTVTGEKKVNYSSSAASEILSLKVEVGDEVKKGDVIAVLDKEAIQSQISLMERSVANAAALKANQSKINSKALKDAKADRKRQLKQAKQAIRDAEAEYEDAQKSCQQLEKNLRDLKKKQEQAQNQEEKELYREQVAGLKADLAAAKEMVKGTKAAAKEASSGYDSVKKAADEAVFAAQNTIDMEKYEEEGDQSQQKQLEELKKQLDDCTVRSRSGGIVTSVNVSLGDVNTPDSPMVTVEDNKNMILTASVPETDILKLREGMKAVVTAEALGDREIGGKVTKVVKVFDGSSSISSGEGSEGEMSAVAPTGGFSVQIRLEKSDLISGMSGKAKILLSEKPDVLCVPYDQVKEDGSGGHYVLCAEDQGEGTYKAVKKPVEIGDEVDYYTEVTGGEVKEGDYVILDQNVMEGEIFTGDISLKDVKSGEHSGETDPSQTGQ